MDLKNSASKELATFTILLILGTLMHLVGPPDSLDMMLFYRAEDAQVLLQSFNDSDSRAYVLNEGLDLVFLGTYSFLFFLLAGRLFPRQIWLRWLSLLPGLFDLIETVTSLCLLLTSGLRPPEWLGFITCLKWISGAGVLIFIGASLVRTLALKFRNPRYLG